MTADAKNIMSNMQQNMPSFIFLNVWAYLDTYDANMIFVVTLYRIRVKGLLPKRERVGGGRRVCVRVVEIKTLRHNIAARRRNSMVCSRHEPIQAH